MRKLVLVLITLLLLTSSCFAAKWEWIGSNPSIGLFVDTSSIKFDISKDNRIVNRDKVYVWVKYVYDEEYAKKHINIDNIKFSISREGYDLMKDEVMYTKANHYDKDGNLLDEDGPNLKWRPIVPDTPVSVVKGYLAQYVPKHVEEIEQRTRGNN